MKKKKLKKRIAELEAEAAARPAASGTVRPELPAPALKNPVHQPLPGRMPTGTGSAFERRYGYL